ncbi:MAG: OmpW family protein [Pseudomonadota bacterium]
MLRSLLALTAAGSALLAPAFAEQGDFILRLRGIVVAPTDEVSDILPTFPGSSLDVQNAVVPELDLTYFLTDRIAVEAIAAISPHGIDATGDLEGLGEVAETLVLPPTITLQYHFAPDAAMRPYVGVGINYTLFFSSDARQSLIDAVGPTSVDINDSIGVSFQAGVDFMINERWSLNADVKYIRIDTTATLDSGGLINQADIELHPIVAGFGVGYHF